MEKSLSADEPPLDIPWSEAQYYAAVRAAELKPTRVSTVYEDPEGNKWHVDDPSWMTPAQRQESFQVLEAIRGRAPMPY